MKENESRKSNVDGSRKKPLQLLIAISVITVMVFAVIGVGSASAAPVGPGGTGTGTGNNGDSWQNKVNNLRGEIAVAKNFQTQPGNNVTGNANNNACMSAQQARYRDEYIATLRAAEALAVRGSSAVIPNTGNSSNNGTSSNGTSSTGNNSSSNNNGGILINGNSSYYASHPDKLLAAYLLRLRQLRSKMNSSDNNGGDMTSKGACIGVGLLNSTGNGTTGTGTGTSSTTSTPVPSTGSATSTPVPSNTPVPSSTPSATPTP